MIEQADYEHSTPESEVPPGYVLPVAVSPERWKRRRRALRQALLPVAVRAASISLGLGAWEWFGRANPKTFAPFSEVCASLWNLATTLDFWRATQETLKTFALGFAAAAVLGVVVGILMAQIPPLGKVSGFYLRLLLAIPLSGIVPLVVVWIGLGLTARVFVVFLFSFTEIALNSYAGVRYADKKLIEMAEAYLTSRVRLFRKVLLPSALPAVMVGLRIGTGNAVIGMVVAELMLINVGLGRFVSKFEQTYQLSNLLATVLVLLSFGALMAVVVQRFERLVTKRYRP